MPPQCSISARANTKGGRELAVKETHVITVQTELASVMFVAFFDCRNAVVFYSNLS